MRDLSVGFVRRVLFRDEVEVAVVAQDVATAGLGVVQPHLGSGLVQEGQRFLALGALLLWLLGGLGLLLGAHFQINVDIASVNGGVSYAGAEARGGAQFYKNARFIVKKGRAAAYDSERRGAFGLP